MNPLYELILVFSKFDPLTAPGMALCVNLGPKCQNLLCGFNDVYMTESHYSLGMVTGTWSTLYLQRQFLIYTILHCAYSGNV
jgi:hypothetical protein